MRAWRFGPALPGVEAPCRLALELALHLARKNVGIDEGASVPLRGRRIARGKIDLDHGELPPRRVRKRLLEHGTHLLGGHAVQDASGQEQGSGGRQTPRAAHGADCFRAMVRGL